MTRILMFGLILAAGCAPAPAGAAEHGRLLLIGQPTLWLEPGPGEPNGPPMNWKAGTELTVFADCPLEAAHGETWFQVGQDAPAGWLPEACLSLPPVDFDESSLRAIGQARVDRTAGLPPNYAPDDLVSVGPRYEQDRDYKLRAEAAEALAAMLAAAKADGHTLYVVSGYRPWSVQQTLYERKVKAAGRDQKTVAKPGHSEHQLGTAVDLTDGNEETLLRVSFGESPAGRWLREHAWEFGFAQSYTEHNEAETGYQPEPWHFRYWGIDQARTKHLRALGVEE
ncbi:MAG TPA: M15 family metallopeptidase [Candidatus Sumerlaeota bacterium]|nr:M15 family metallopeptidase [Candidatus Sumerlaeota bacterium]HPK03500.1 M15 family metallopeptidase [Candidatus Sumerlaeota bacterium]